jgi:GGDEF domain-containing protein
VVIDKIKHVFDAAFVIDAETNLAIGVSVGVAIYPDDGLTPSGLMRTADNDMYLHKPRHIHST